MTREKMIENLKEIGDITLDSKEIEEVIPLTYDYLEGIFKSRASQEALEAFQNGEYLVDILFCEDEIIYYVGVDRQQLNNEPRWADDKWDDIDDEVLKSLIKGSVLNED
jgi:hypothetical protein